MRLVLVGPPGSGKGTQAERLVREWKLLYVGTGEILREAIKQRTPVGLQAEPFIRRGELVPDMLVNDLVAELFRTKRPDRFVMDGYPRTASQAASFDALLKQQYMTLDAVINLTISDDEVVRRISSRWCCSNQACLACYNTVARPPKTPGICDLCGSALMQRTDDQESTVRRRLEGFHAVTDDLIAHYRRQSLVIDVSATEKMDVIYQTIVSHLPQM
jgi:adenylate kinase